MSSPRPAASGGPNAEGGLGFLRGQQQKGGWQELGGEEWGSWGQPPPLGHVIVGFKSFPQATRYGTNQYQPQE